MIDTIDLMSILLVVVKYPITKKGIDTTGRIREISKSDNSLINMAIPVTPPSRKPLGNKKAFKPMLARKMATPNWTVSEAASLMVYLLIKRRLRVVLILSGTSNCPAH